MTKSVPFGLPVQSDNIPNDLLDMERWIPWTAVPKEDGKYNKVPKRCSAPDRNASTSVPEHWGTAKDALLHYETRSDINGIGFVVSGLAGFVFIDLDDVVDPETGSIADWASEIVEKLNTYAELSPSGKGLRLIGRALLPGPDFTNTAAGIEMYGGHGDRYLTITGHALEDQPLPIRAVDEKVLGDVYRRYSTANQSPRNSSTTMPTPDPDAPNPEDIVALEEWQRAFLVDRDASGYDDDRSRALMGCVQRLCNLGYTDAQVLGILLKSPGAMETARARRGNNEQSALEWIWKYTCLKAQRDPGSSTGIIDIAPHEAPLVTKDAVTHRGITIEPPAGILSDVYQLMLRSAHYPQPIFAIGAALSLISLLMGNKYRTEGSIYGNIYMLSIGPTGCGKDSPRMVAKHVMQQLGKHNHVSDGVASGPGLEDYIIKLNPPSAMLLLDEFGKFLQLHTGRNKDEHGVIGILLKLYTAVGSFYTKRLKASGTNELVNHPYVSLYGTTTAGALHSALSEGDTEVGWLGRMLFLPTDNARPEYQEPTPLGELPESLLPWFNEIDQPKPQSVMVDYQEPAEKRLEIIRIATDDYLKSNAINPLARACLVRKVEMLKKIALISAVSRNAIKPVIDLRDVAFASSVVEVSTKYVEDDLVSAIESAGIQSPEASLMTRCLDFIQRVRSYKDAEHLPATSKGFMPLRLLMKKTKLGKQTLMRLINALIESGQIARVTLTKEIHGIHVEEAYYIPG